VIIAIAQQAYQITDAHEGLLPSEKSAILAKFQRHR
jgi:hypothetical protein